VVVAERTVVLGPGGALAFLRDACRALGEAVDERGGADPELEVVYAELVACYARVLRPEIVRLPEGSVAWSAIIDHLLDRLSQARRREVTLGVVEVAGRLHAELEQVMTRLV
jgi:hypothetical protein